MPNLVIVTGPQAVGKMTVAECLKEKIGYALMVNHDSIEAAFDTAIKYNKDFIFTFVMAYDSEKDWKFVNKLRAKFEESGGNLYFIELEADVETRLKRNVTAHRLEAKPSKKNIEWSNQDLLKTMDKHRLNSKEGEKVCPNHIKINNTNLSPEEVVNIIVDKFNL